jgi:subtilisin family serine protease
MVGVAPKSKIIPVKVLDKNGNGSLSNVSKGIRWAVDNGADIITMSLGAPRPLQSVRKSIQYAYKKGVPCFVAAGNAGKTKEVFYPAAYPETIAIGSIDSNFKRSDFSNTGKNLDFMSPGGKIFSTVPDNWYAFLSGTSMACPFAVGVAALLLSCSRKSNSKIEIKSVNDYRELLKQGTIPIKNKNYAGKKFFEGFGIIDPRKFTEWANTH